MARAPLPGRDASERSILVAIADETRVEALLGVAEPLVRYPPRVMVMARLVPDAAALQATSAWLETHRSGLGARGVVAEQRHSPRASPVLSGRLASELDVDLLLTDAPDDLLVDGAPNEQLTATRGRRPATLRCSRPATRVTEGPVLVPFGGADHDWAAVELGAWLAHAAGVPLRLAGTAAVPERGKRDASRLLSHGALAVQRVLGISAEPLLTPPGENGDAGGEPRRGPRRGGPVRPGGTARAWAAASGSRERRPRPCCSSVEVPRPRWPRSARRPDPFHLVDSRLGAGRVNGQVPPMRGGFVAAQGGSGRRVRTAAMTRRNASAVRPGLPTGCAGPRGRLERGSTTSTGGQAASSRSTPGGCSGR